jgi:hypothetical protein
MKKIFYTALVLLASGQLQAQFLKKLKSKVNDVVNTTTPAAPTQQAGDVTGNGFTDPAKYGVLLKVYSKGEINKAMGGDAGNFGLHFEAFKVVNGQFTATIADVLSVYTYQNGQFQNTGQKPTPPIHLATAYNGSEGDFQCTDFTAVDTYNAMLKKGPHVQSGRQPGKIDQEFSFNGKPFARFMSAMISHNTDSTVVAAAGMSYDKKVSYVMTSSTGQTLTLAGVTMSAPIISPNGKKIALINTTAAGSIAYYMDGTKTPLTYYNGGAWIRNSGAIFYPSIAGKATLVRNGKVVQGMPYDIDMKHLFIGSNDDAFCFPGDHCLCFSDGTRFENADFPVKVNINGKDAVYFTAVNVVTGTLFLCHHDL